MPLIYFYSRGGLVAAFFRYCYNRRRIKSTLNKAEDLDKIYSEVGKDHIGYDMFVFKKSLFPKFILNNTCIGIPFVGNDLFLQFILLRRKTGIVNR